MSSLKSTGEHPKLSLLEEPVIIHRIIRRMRGGSQSLLVQCSDERYYVAKFLGNPQGHRTLMNELIAYQLITQLQVLTPPLILLHLPEDLVKDDQLYFLMGKERVRPKGYLHLGSQVPVNPNQTAIFDFLPERLLQKISNVEDFATIFVADRWLYQTDFRQAIYIRDKRAHKPCFLAYFVDHGKCFDGSNWDFRDAPLHGLPLHRKLYSEIDMRGLVEEALSKVEAISAGALLATAHAIPAAWFAPGDRECLTAMLGQLGKRQLTLPLLVRRHLSQLGV